MAPPSPFAPVLKATEYQAAAAPPAPATPPATGPQSMATNAPHRQPQKPHPFSSALPSSPSPLALQHKPPAPSATAPPAPKPDRQTQGRTSGRSAPPPPPSARAPYRPQRHASECRRSPPAAAEPHLRAPHRPNPHLPNSNHPAHVLRIPSLPLRHATLHRGAARHRPAPAAAMAHLATANPGTLRATRRAPSHHPRHTPQRRPRDPKRRPAAPPLMALLACEWAHTPLHHVFRLLDPCFVWRARCDIGAGR